MLNSDKLKLFYTPRSPFARRVRLTFDRLGISYDEEAIEVFNPPPHFLAVNPLGLVPALVGPGGFSLSDSSMILEWAHQKTGRVYSPGALEWPERQACVLCTGLIHSLVLFFQETKLHDAPSGWWTQDHFSAIKDTMRVLESLPSELFLRGRELTQAGWDLATAMEYMNLRLPEYKWKELHPSFVEVLELAHTNPKFAATVPVI